MISAEASLFEINLLFKLFRLHISKYEEKHRKNVTIVQPWSQISHLERELSTRAIGVDSLLDLNEEKVWASNKEKSRQCSFCSSHLRNGS